MTLINGKTKKEIVMEWAVENRPFPCENIREYHERCSGSIEVSVAYNYLVKICRQKLRYQFGPGLDYPPEGITRKEYQSLKFIRSSQKPVGYLDVAAAVRTSESYARKMVQKLQRTGHVQRRPELFEAVEE